MNWGYKTIPQVHCNDREIDYSRGRGLGGSSTINFSAYTIGCRDDYDEWARIVDDDAFGWERMQSRLKEIETFHGEISDGEVAKYAAPRPSDHGSKGRLHVGYAASWESDFASTLESLHQAGLPLNPDHNSGNPLGLAVMMNSAHKGIRSTSADLLPSSQDNLKIVTMAPVQRLCYQGKRVVGVESNGKQCEWVRSVHFTFVCKL
jgi:choline dehydrogenase-like flavoprotein